MVLGAATESDDDEMLVQRPPRASSASGVSESDLRPLEATARKARAAGSTSPQVGLEHERGGRGGGGVAGGGSFVPLPLTATHSRNYILSTRVLSVPEGVTCAPAFPPGASILTIRLSRVALTYHVL